MMVSAPPKGHRVAGLRPRSSEGNRCEANTVTALTNNAPRRHHGAAAAFPDRALQRRTRGIPFAHQRRHGRCLICWPHQEQATDPCGVVKPEPRERCIQQGIEGAHDACAENGSVIAYQMQWPAVERSVPGSGGAPGPKPATNLAHALVWCERATRLGECLPPAPVPSWCFPLNCEVRPRRVPGNDHPTLSAPAQA
jgi:hypothetical protein